MRNRVFAACLDFHGDLYSSPTTLHLTHRVQHALQPPLRTPQHLLRRVDRVDHHLLLFEGECDATLVLLNGLEAEEEPLHDARNTGVESLVRLAHVDRVRVDRLDVVLQQTEDLLVEDLDQSRDSRLR